MRGRLVEGFAGYPDECSEWSDEKTCIRTSIFADECRGEEKINFELVFQAPLDELSYSVAQCIDEVSDGYNYGVRTFDPLVGFCDYETSRPRNQKMNSRGNPAYKPLECFSFAHVEFQTMFNANYFDFFFRLSAFEGSDDRSYFELHAEQRDRQPFYQTKTSKLVNALYTCVGDKLEPATTDRLDYLPCSQSRP